MSILAPGTEMHSVKYENKTIGKSTFSFTCMSPDEGEKSVRVQHRLIKQGATKIIQPHHAV
jgi:hypothetical protein